VFNFCLGFSKEKPPAHRLLFISKTKMLFRPITMN